MLLAISNLKCTPKLGQEFDLQEIIVVLWRRSKDKLDLRRIVYNINVPVLRGKFS